LGDEILLSQKLGEHLKSFLKEEFFSVLDFLCRFCVDFDAICMPCAYLQGADPVVFSFVETEIDCDYLVCFSVGILA
jgi:hypothetical protein